MKIRILDKILNYEGRPIKESGASDSPDITWRSVIFTALNNFAQDEKPTGEIKTKCYQITKKVFDSNEPDLTVDQRALVLERIEKIYSSPLIIGRSKEFFEEAKEEK